MNAYIYDIAVVLILLLGVVIGYKRGVIRTILSLMCLLISFTVASAVSSPEVCSSIYEKYMHETVAKYIDDGVSKARNQAKEKINEYLKESAYKLIDELPFGSEMMKEYVDETANTDGIAAIYEFLGIDIHTLLTNPEISGKISMIADEYSVTAADTINSRLPLGISVKTEDIRKIMTDTDAQEAFIYEIFGVSSEDSGNISASVYIENTVVRPILLRMIGTVIWTVIFSAVNFILHIAVQIILVIRKAAPVKMCDSVLGAALGAVAGMAVVSALTVVIVMVVSFTGGMSFMNEDIFSETILFGRIYGVVCGLTG